MKLWSLRWKTTTGWQWELERDCSIVKTEINADSVVTDNSQQWLEYFQKSEPNISFKLSLKKPKLLNKVRPIIAQ